jgi:hypothetical protein
VNVYVPKSLVNDVSAFRVYLDDEPLTYTATSIDDSIIVTFTYHHSNHEVTVKMNTTPSQLPNNNQNSYMWIIIVATVVAVIITVAVLVKRRGKRNKSN